ncbi:XrtA/PEP-CTERM system TPR-repeat protein PrsT [Methyloversatilis universalis]|uniref:XrtA/PEP-CTERM system TPR-repeat protein PrsT n=1 Tax=Methyloversatilis universalis TaxID=378211 RepID=UPI0003605ABF|nr:XrtA/PEP-CTERM system TPR-repeat protein PrsT [Methyloversatilis universalis]
MSRPVISRLLAALLCAVALTACNRSKPPEELLGDARAAIERNDVQTAAIQLKNALQQDGSNAAARFELGRLHLRVGDGASAVKELNRAAELKHPEVQVAPALARALLETGQFSDVASRFAAVRLDQPAAQAELRALVGRALLAAGNADGALAAFDESLAIDAMQPDALVGKARMLGMNKDFKAAQALLDKVLTSPKPTADAWFLDAEMKAFQGQGDPSLASYRKVYEIAPENVRARSIVISALANEGRIEEARKELDGLRKVMPRSPDINYLDGMLFVKEKKFIEARDRLSKVLAVAPDFVPALGLAAATEYELQSYAMAEQHAEKAISRGADTLFIRKLLIGSYLRNGRTDKAKQALAPLLKTGETDPEIQALAGQVYLSAGDAKAAERAFAVAAKQSPDDPVAQTRLGISRLATGDRSGGVRALEGAVNLGDKDARADLVLVMTHLRNREPDQALVAIDAMERKLPKDPAVQNLRGTAQLLKSDPRAARAAFSRAVELEPAYFPAVANLARLDMLDGKVDDAEARFRKVIEHNPRNADALQALAGLKARNRAGVPEAIALLNKAIEGNPKLASPRAALVDLYMATGDGRAALKAASDAATALPEDTLVLQALAMAQGQSGDFDAAIATRKRIVDREPGSLSALLMLAATQMSGKRESEAIQTVKKALVVEPESLEAQNMMIAIHRSRGALDDALRVARDVQRQRPKQAVGFIMEGELMLASSKPDVAARSFREAYSREHNGSNLTRLHAALTRAGANRDAQTLVDAWMKEQPKDVVVPLYLGDVALAQKKLDEAKGHYQTVLARAPSEVAALNNLAWIAAQSGDAKAREYAEKAYSISPSNPAVLDTLGAILVDAGDVDRGVKLMREGVAIAPQSNDLRLSLASALARAGRKADARKELEPLSAMGSKYPRAAEVAALMKTL